MHCKAESEKKQRGLAEIMRPDLPLHGRGCSALRTGLGQDQFWREWTSDSLDLALCSAAQLPTCSAVLGLLRYMYSSSLDEARG